MPRPAYRFRSFIGHRRKVEPVIREVRGAKARGVPASHMIIFGPSGVGKSLLARSLADEYGTTMVKLIGAVTVAELLKAVEQMKPGDFLFLDEAHNLSQEVQEMLYQIMESRIVVTSSRSEPIEVPPITIILATDKPGCLENALHKRVPTELHLGLYSDKEMKEIAEEVAQREDLLLSPQAANKIATVCNGLPRRAEQLLHKLRMYYPDAEADQMSLPLVNHFLDALGIDEWGFGERERSYLRFLRREGSASVATLAAVLGVDPQYVERQVEPRLRRHGFVRIGAGGRSLTKAGRVWMKNNLSGKRPREE